jgi:hypothetical protein
LDELGFSWRGGPVFVEELTAVLLVASRVLRRQDGCAGGEAVGQRIERRAPLAGFGSRTG